MGLGEGVGVAEGVALGLGEALSLNCSCRLGDFCFCTSWPGSVASFALPVMAKYEIAPAARIHRIKTI